MEGYWDQFITTLIPIVTPIIIGAVTWFFKELFQLIITKRKEIKNKVIYEQALQYWYKVEQYYKSHPELQRVVNDKYDMLKDMIKSKYPSITDEQIDDLIEAISGMINCQKIENGISNTAVTETTATTETPAVVIEPKYTTPDGVELQPVPSTTTEQ